MPRNDRSRTTLNPLQHQPAGYEAMNGHASKDHVSTAGSVDAGAASHTGEMLDTPIEQVKDPGNQVIDVSIVVPAYNEQKRIGETVKKIIEFCHQKPYQTEVIIVDDGSQDDTAAIVAGLIDDCEYKGIRLVRNEHRGKAVAVQTGMLEATGNIILFTDADLATPIEAIEDVLPYFAKGYDIVIGSREGLNARRIGEPIYRHIMGRVFNRVVQYIAFSGLDDTQCGFKAFSKQAAQDIFSRMKLYGPDAKVVKQSMVTAFDVEVLFIGKKLGYKIKAIPVQWTYGVSTKVNPINDSIRNFGDVVRVRINIWRGLYD